MSSPIFKNKPNGRIQMKYTAPDGAVNSMDYWISRAVAVVGVVFAIKDNSISVLIEKRSKNMRDETLKMGVPCGYLDWDETKYDAMVREVYEETSFYMKDYEKFLIFNNNKMPFMCKDDPSENRQNVSDIYLTVFDFDNEPDKFPVDVEKFSCHEVEFVRWMSLREFYNTCNNYHWAFNHDETIKSALKFFTNNFDKRFDQ